MPREPRSKVLEEGRKVFECSALKPTKLPHLANLMNHSYSELRKLREAALRLAAVSARQA